jgi:hypothetical protein
MRRQFEFSVDSFQITLDPLLDLENLNAKDDKLRIIAESMFGDFPQALRHLHKRLIDTRSPEEIRGGGLLKYCHLMTRGYEATQNCRELERYMCSRFFIDFPDIATQEFKLRGFLDNHFGNEDEVSACFWGLKFRNLCGLFDSTSLNVKYARTRFYCHFYVVSIGMCKFDLLQMLRMFSVN